MNYLFYGVYLFSLIVNLFTYSYIIATKDVDEIEFFESHSNPFNWIFISIVLSFIPMVNIGISIDCFKYFIRKINQ